MENWSKFRNSIWTLSKGIQVRFICREANDYIILEATNIVIVLGSVVLYKDEIRKMFDLKCFLDIDSDARLSNRG